MEYNRKQNLERFSFECRKVISFALATLNDWLKKFAPIFHSISSKTKTNRDSLARVFLRFASTRMISQCFRNYVKDYFDKKLTAQKRDIKHEHYAIVSPRLFPHQNTPL